LVATRFAVAVDLGGTRFRVALCDARGALRARHTYPTESARGPDRILEHIASAIRTVLAAAPADAEVAGIGVAAPGPLDPWRGLIYQAPNLPGWENLPLAERLAALTGYPVRVGNDANLAALGEHRFGAGRGVAHLVYVTVSTGVGGGIIVNNELWLGARGAAGEIGHTVIERYGPPCSCGNRGCVEALASGTAIARRAAAALAAGRPSRLGAAGTQPSAEAVARAAADGDALAIEILEEAARALAVGLVNLLHLCDPQLIVIGGGVARAGEHWWRALRDEVARRALPVYRQELRLVPAALGDDAGLVGAAAMVL
jgi:glucokinase